MIALLSRKSANTFVTRLTAVARILLVPIERSDEIERRAVDVDLTGSQSCGDFAHLLTVSAVDVSRQFVAGVVVNRDSLVDCAVADDDQHRAEDLLSGDLYVVGDVVGNRWLHISLGIQSVRTSSVTGHKSGALVDAGLEQTVFSRTVH